MAGCVWCILRAVLGRRTREIVWRVVCGDFGNFFNQFNSRRILDTSHFVGFVLGSSTVVECIMPAIFMPCGGFHWWPVLRRRTDAELLCNQPLSPAHYIWHFNR